MVGTLETPDPQGLEDDVLGGMATIADLDVENIVKEATTEVIQRKEQRINEAWDRDQSAAAKQRDLFAYVSPYDPDENRHELHVSRDHVPGFVGGMLPEAGIELAHELHGGGPPAQGP